jgi:hypothetical protein
MLSEALGQKGPLFWAFPPYIVTSIKSCVYIVLVDGEYRKYREEDWIPLLERIVRNVLFYENNFHTTIKMLQST